MGNFLIAQMTPVPWGRFLVEIFLVIRNQSVVVLKQKFEMKRDEKKDLLVCECCFLLVPKKLWYFETCFFSRPSLPPNKRRHMLEGLYLEVG